MKLLRLGYSYFYVFLTKLNMDCIRLNLDRYFRSPRPIYRALVYQATARFKAFTFCLFSDVNMVRKYIKTTNRANINESNVAAAINEITNGNCSLRNSLRSCCYLRDTFCNPTISPKTFPSKASNYCRATSFRRWR